jgi:hypoxanthine phosphoribosyltransferase
MKRYLTADTFQRDCIRLAKKVYDDADWQPELLLALWRGGAQPGVIMSEVFAFLGRPVAHAVVKCSSYAGIGERTNTVVFQNADALLDAIRPGCKVLVVDDVFDSGKTAEAVKKRLNKADVRMATVYWKPTERKVDFLPDYTLREINEWIVFPHELDGLTADELRTKDPEIADLLLG